MTFKRSAICVVAISLLAATAQSASAALPRPGYWQARIGKDGPQVGMLVADSRRQILTTIGRMDVECPDGHTHTLNFGAPNVAVDPTGAFSTSHMGPPDEFDHPGVDGWRFGGAFTTTTRARGGVSLLWTGEGEPCAAPRDRRTWTAQWRADPKLTVTPSTVRRGGTLTLRGSGFLPRRHVHVELPNRLFTIGTITVLQQRFTKMADRRGRFTASVKVPRLMKTTQLWRAQAWQLQCTEVCWVHADDFYRVSR